ncbi:DUF2817 domain-containing protein [Pseudomonas nicosulfuronedens]
MLRLRGRQRRETAWIDRHTGLGPTGDGESSTRAARARACWGSDLRSMDEGSSYAMPSPYVDTAPWRQACAGRCRARDGRAVQRDSRVAALML